MEISLGLLFVITVILFLIIYLSYEGRYYILYFFSLVRNKFKFQKDLNKLMTENLLKRNFKDEEINECIDFMIKSLNEKDYEVNGEFKVRDDLKRRLIYSRYDEKSIKLLVNEIFDFLKLYDKDVEVTVTYKSSKVKTGIAGLYNYNLEKIEIFVDPNYSFENIVSIVAHECTHHFFAKKGIIIKDRIKNEMMTDLALIYLGFSKYVFEGYKEKRRVIYEDETHRLVDRNKVGYLGYLDVKYANKYIKKKIRKEN